jgi:hypothetical protein
MCTNKRMKSLRVIVMVHLNFKLIVHRNHEKQMTNCIGHHTCQWFAMHQK